ncbi:sigma 54 modulation/S30EA ribosomal C-terminal domain-containing protein [Kribbella sp. NPDC050281]|uniref:sigma 54 modulation/S30EA ribosomal C-terminal domain-containing protein n=1 Tax=Kribbella sp. NPDC050281 TaxID=3155515 RepID=UPI0033F53363
MLVAARNALPARSAALLQVTTKGILPTDAAAVVNEHLVPILGSSAAHSRVRLTRLSEPGLARPVVAQLDVQLSRHRVRAQVAAATTAEVVSMLAAHTIEQLHRFPGALAECLRDRTTTSLPPSPPELVPPSARRLVRRKIARPTAMTVAEAIAALEAMDYRFHLFRDKYSRQDSVVSLTGSGYQVVQRTHRLTVSNARARLDLTGSPFEIFTDETTGSTCALYTRYDGHYGILTTGLKPSA